MSDREAWLQTRKKGIGGSEIAPILGLSPWKTAYQVWEDKTGISTGEIEDNPAMAYGRLMEPVIRQWYSNETGRPVMVPDSVLVHPKYEFIIGSVDGLTPDNRVIEIKTGRSAKDWGEPGTDQIPIWYMTQVQYYMLITGFGVADVPVSFAGSMPEIYEVPADRELQDLILEAVVDFWRMVQDRIPPDPVSYSDMLSRFGGKSVPNSVKATDEALEAWSELKKIKKIMAGLEAEEEQAKAVIMGLLGENEVLTEETGKTLATWKLAEASSRFDSKSFQADYPDLYTKYMKTGEPARRFLIK